MKGVYLLVVLALALAAPIGVNASSVVVPVQVELLPPELTLSVSQNVSFGMMPKPKGLVTCSLDQDGVVTEVCGLVGAQVGIVDVTGSADAFVQVSGTGYSGDGFLFTPRFMGAGATPGENVQFQMSPVGDGEVIVFGDLAVVDLAAIGVGVVSFSTTVTMTYN